MATLYDVGDEIIGDKIVCEARRIGDSKVINKSGRNKAQKIQIKDNARCRILKQARFLSDE